MAMGFVPSVLNQGHAQGWEYLPAKAETFGVGEALKWDSGKLTKCSGTTKPEYISMTEQTVSVAGTEIAVIRVEPDALYDVPAQASVADVALGTKVTIYTDGMQITATTSSGVAEIVGKQGTGAAGDIITVKFN